jgi:hypothetical protein
MLNTIAGLPSFRGERVRIEAGSPKNATSMASSPQQTPLNVFEFGIYFHQ